MMRMPSPEFLHNMGVASIIAGVVTGIVLLAITPAMRVLNKQARRGRRR